MQIQFFLANYRSSPCFWLVFVSVRVPLLHHGIVEVFVGKEAGTEDHGQTHGQHGSHHAAVDDGVDTFPSLSLLLFPILVFILRRGNYTLQDFVKNKKLRWRKETKTSELGLEHTTVDVSYMLDQGITYRYDLKESYGKGKKPEVQVIFPGSLAVSVGGPAYHYITTA